MHTGTTGLIRTDCILARQEWRSGCAVELSASKDPRWMELERRIILSQYATAIQCSGQSPPQETGLFINLQWYGKFHLEMIAWHGVHFALWGREHLLERWMEWMRTNGYKGAKKRAERQAYKGVRWNKMIDREASWESPSLIGPYRITQQGHAIYIAKLLYRINPSAGILEKYAEMISGSVELMADFVNYDPETDLYVIGPPVISGAEAVFAPEGQNPTVGLSYWAYGL